MCELLHPHNINVNLSKFVEEEKITQTMLEPMLDKYVNEVFGESFTFRPQQKEAVLDILESFYDGHCDLYLLDAPTGSGKSVIAMIVSGFLSHQKMKGYILASDLALQQQYERDCLNFRLSWGSIKGVDNYWCHVNSERFSLGECRLRNTSYEKAESLPCFQECGYLMARKKAIASPVTLLNYSYWLIQRNYVEPKMLEQGKGVPFSRRDFTICDEAHKISDIVQNHFSPKIDEKTFDKMEKLRSVLVKANLLSPKTSNVRLRTVIKNLSKEEDPGKLYALLKEFELQLLDFVNAGNSIKDFVAKRYPGNMEVPIEWRRNLGLVDWCKDMHCKFEDYNHIISQTSMDSIVKNPQGEQTVFNCLDESYMMNKHFHTQAGFKLLMTATMGDAKSFLKTINGQNARYFRMESTFNFEKSPIYFYTKHRMSINEKDRSMPWIIKKVEEILENSQNSSGIIHSGSYEITSRIFEGISSKYKERVLVYKGSQEKEEILKRFVEEKNLVLMGPSILEGLDLGHDKSRFQVFLKVPYPSIADRFVKAKMNYSPEWYTWKTCCSILQGVGRSVRSEEDWAVTYMLDGCFVDLLRKSRTSFPREIQQRIKLVNE